MARTRDRDRDDDDRPRRPPEPVARDGAYVMMLVITLLAVGVGCFLMYKDNEDYGKTLPPKEAALTVPRLGDQPKAGTPEVPLPPPMP